MTENAQSHGDIPRGPDRRSTGRGKTLMRLSMIGVVCALVASAAVIVLAEGLTAQLRNYVANPTFESGADGWVPSKTGILKPASGHASEQSAELVNASDETGQVSMTDWPRSVTASNPARTYRATAWVRTERPVSVMLQLAELEPHGRNEASVVRQTVTTKAQTWSALTVSYRPRVSGVSLGLTITAADLLPGRGISIDDVSLCDGSKNFYNNRAGIPEPVYRSAASGLPETAVSADGEASHGHWKQVWSDEFNGARLDERKWSALDRSTYGDGNQELACLMDRPENLKVSGGLLHVIAQREKRPIQCGAHDQRFPDGRRFTSAHLETRGKASFEYGRFEIRAKTPNAIGMSKGLWPGFWMRPVAGGLGEIDVMEIAGSGRGGPDRSHLVTQTIHYDYSGTHPKQANLYALPHGTFASGFHVFAVEWEPGEIRWYVDGVLTYTRNVRTTPWLNEAFIGDFYLRLNMSVGSSYLGAPDTATIFPSELQVDYIRVYQR